MKLELILAVLLFAGCVGGPVGGIAGDEVEGTIVVIGSEPFTQVAIRAEDGTYELRGDVAEELRDYQGHEARVIGKWEEPARPEKALVAERYEILE